MKVFDPDSLEAKILDKQKELSPLKTRTNLFNLVIFSSPEHSKTVDTGIDYLLGKRPARIIRIKMGDFPTTEAQASARCLTDKRNNGICLQEIVIKNGPDNAGAVPGSWSSLLIRGIPVFLLWFCDYGENRELLQLANEQADKIIVDSETQREKFIETLKNMVIKEGMNVIDLTWIRSGDLRRNTAFLFDRQQNLPLLDTIEGITICGGRPALVRLYLLWLASRLKWTVKGDSYRNSSGQKISIRHQTPKPIEQGIEVFFDAGGKTLSLTGNPAGCSDMDSGEIRERERFRVPGTGEMLIKETDSVYTDPLFLEALE